MLDDKLQAANIARGFVSALGSPSHLHERGNRNRSIDDREIAAHECVRLEGTRTQDAKAAIAEIINSAVEFLGRGTRRLARQQTPRMDFQHLRKPLMLASLL